MKKGGGKNNTFVLKTNINFFFNIYSAKNIFYGI